MHFRAKGGGGGGQKACKVAYVITGRRLYYRHRLKERDLVEIHENVRTTVSSTYHKLDVDLGDGQ